MLQRQGATDCQ